MWLGNTRKRNRRLDDLMRVLGPLDLVLVVALALLVPPDGSTPADCFASSVGKYSTKKTPVRRIHRACTLHLI